jgi:potassium-dependent mechanosensitive channel
MLVPAMGAAGHDRCRSPPLPTTDEDAAALPHRPSGLLRSAMLRRLTHTSLLACRAALLAMALAGSPAIAQQPAAPQPAAPQTATPRPAATQPAASQTAATQPAASTTPLPEERPPEADLEVFKTDLDDISKGFEDAHTEDELLALRQRLSPLRDQMRQRSGVLEPRLKQITDSLAELGAAPAAGAPPEDATVAGERSRLTATQTEFDGAVKQARLLSGRADELADRINARRRQIFTDRLFAHSANLFDPSFWASAAALVPGETRTVSSILRSWMVVAQATYDPTSVLAAAATLLAIGAVAAVAIYWTRRFTARPAPRRFDKALRALVVLAAHAVAAAGLIAAFVLVLRDYRLIPQPAADLLFGLAAAFAVAGFGRGVAVALFAPGQSGRRIIPWADRTADIYAAHLSWGAAALGITIFLSAVHRATGAPLAPVVATWALFALAFVVIAMHLLLRPVQPDPRAEDATAVVSRLPWLRILLWPIAVAVAVALVAGYVGFAAFLAVRLLAVLAIVGALVVALVFVDAFATEVIASDTPRGRRMAVLFGITPNALDLLIALVSAVVRLFLIVAGVLLLVDYSGLFADDIVGVFQISRWDFAIGGLNLAPANILAALAILLVGLVAVRAAQSWLETQFLPHTRFDAGLQNSIAALSGYSALVAVLALALGALGIDLQKIALIAGALSVGIGFGLQSVVSNFVCGLILLAERPIRVGDWVVVKNEEGWVRRINVRATEIETFDRASVIIPNQDFITGVVKNLTHGNTMGRVVVKVRVAFDSDAEKVRAVLRACGEEYPHVLRAPPPMVYLMGIGDIGLEFELRCLIADVGQSIAVSTELRLEILRRFAQHAIKIAFLPHEARLPGPSAAPASRAQGA